MKSLIIIPAYNEANNVPDLVKKIEELGYEYLVINDCSTDNSVEVYDKNAINYLNLPLNLGLASVTQAGFRYAEYHNYDCAIVIDGDGQHPPFNIEKLLNKIEKGYDYVIGSRYVEVEKPWSLRMIGSRIISFFIFIKTGKKITDPTSGMRALSKKVMHEFSENMNFIAEPDALVYLLKKGFNVDKRKIKLDNPLSSLGFHEVEIELHKEVIAKVKVQLIK